MDLQAAFALEVVTDPQVVVAREEDHADAAVGQLGQLAQRAHKPFGHDPLVLEPEVEDVTHKEDRLGVVRHGVEPRDEPALDTLRRSPVARTQMYVGCEIVHQRVSSSSFASRLLP